jgi:hypothetical protein
MNEVAIDRNLPPTRDANDVQPQLAGKLPENEVLKALRHRPQQLHDARQGKRRRWFAYAQVLQVLQVLRVAGSVSSGGFAASLGGRPGH